MSQSVDTTLGKFVGHLIRGFTPELAKHFAELPRPNPEFQARLDELAEKANEGTLSPEEAANYPHLFIYGSGGSGRTRYRGAERIMRYIDVRSLRW